LYESGGLLTSASLPFLSFSLISLWTLGAVLTDCVLFLSLSFYTVPCALYAKLLKLLFHLSPSADESCACALRAQERQRADYAETSCTTQRERCFFRRALKSLFETRRSINMLSMFEGEVAEFKVTSKYLS